MADPFRSPAHFECMAGHQGFGDHHALFSWLKCFQIHRLRRFHMAGVFCMHNGMFCISKHSPSI